MDNNQNSKSKTRKKHMKRNTLPLLRPDVMLITKDVMVPVKLPPPPGKLFPIQQKTEKKKCGVAKMQRSGTQALKPLVNCEDLRKNCIDPLIQVSDITHATKARIDVFPKSQSGYHPRKNVPTKNAHMDEKRPISLRSEKPSSPSNSKLFQFGRSARSSISPTPKISLVDKLSVQSSKDSMSTVPTSLETQSYTSIKSLNMIDDSLTKVLLNIISSSESESNVNYAAQPSTQAQYDLRTPVANNVSSNMTENPVGTFSFHHAYSNNNERIECTKGGLEDCLNSDLCISSSNQECHEQVANQVSIPIKECDVDLDDCDMNKLTSDSKVSFLRQDPACLQDSCEDEYENEIKLVKNDADTNDRKIQLSMDVDYLLQSLISNILTLECSNNSNECIIKKRYSPCILLHPESHSEKQEVEKLGDNSNERLPRIVGLKYSLHDLLRTTLDSDDHILSCTEQLDIDSELKYSRQDLLDSSLTREGNEEQLGTVNCHLNVNGNLSDQQVEIKYSWQIIPLKNENLQLDEVCNSKQKVQNCGNHSKLTSTEDLHLIEPEYQYSWQRLTSKYLSEKSKENCLFDINELAMKVSDAQEKCTESECIRNNFNSILSNSCAEKSQSVEHNRRTIVNPPLDNIISSRLPQINIISNATADITSKYRENFLEYPSKPGLYNSSISYSSISSIKHVIANLNEMVTTQKGMLDAYVKDHGLDRDVEQTKAVESPVTNTAEKVEIFPSTLHVLGDYIVKDILPADMSHSRRLLDANNDEMVQDHSLSEEIVSAANVTLDERIKSALSGKILYRNDRPVTLDIGLLRSIDHSPKLLLDPKKDDPSLSSDPISYDINNYLTSILAPNDNFYTNISNSIHNKCGTCNSDENRISLSSEILETEQIPTDVNWKAETAEMEKQALEPPMDLAQHINKEKDVQSDSLSCTKNTVSKPRLQVSFTETKEAGDNNTKKDELTTRLENAMSRLQQCEQHIDANWNLDYSVLDIEEGISDEGVQLPEQVEAHIKDIIKSAEEYLGKLDEQLNDLRNADDQIINSSERTLKNIDETYQLIMDNLCKEIKKRRDLVKLETEVLKCEGLAPLRACKQEVDAQIRSTRHLIVLTDTMLTHPVTFNRDRLGKIITATSHMGRIPAVPLLEELPYVTFSPPSEEAKKEILDRISCLGCVLRMGPAQFTEVLDRPAGLRLKWHVVDPEYASEEQTFIVQKALGEIIEPTSPAFETVYVGPDTSCFIREIPVDQPITLRVGIQMPDTAWSIHRITRTSIPAYSWDMNNADYLVTNSGRIATKITRNLSTLLSRSAQFGTDQIIEFKFLETVSGSNDEGIGLVLEPDGVNESLKRSRALLITPNGNIFIDGEEKLMQLPKMQLGTRIIFTSEKKDDDTLRMTIECANKAVTYDWTVQTPLHFAARFLEHNKWNFMIK